MTRQPQDKGKWRILVLHDDSKHYYAILKRRFPELQFELAATTETAVLLADQFDPHIIFSWTSPKIEHDVQRRILLRPNVEWVQVGGAGFDHLLPLDQLTAVFTNTGGLLSQFLAETVLGAMLMLNFRFHDYMQQQQRKEWRQLDWTPISTKTVLVVGLGNIGRKVAQKAKQQGMRVLGVRSSLTPVAGVDEVRRIDQLHELLPQADYVTLHVPLKPNTQHLIGAKELSLMKPSAFLLNTARGAVVDEAALIEALANNEIAGAYADVFESEPLPSDSPLWHLHNMVISPHYADSVADWEWRYAELFFFYLERWLGKRPLLNVVNLNRED